MSQRGNCYDNALPGTACAESFWSRFQPEQLNGGGFRGRAEATLESSQYVAYYNAERRHSAPGYHLPSPLETGLQTTSHFVRLRQTASFPVFVLPLGT